MILAAWRRWRARQAAVEARARQTADLFIRASGGHIHRAFWRVHERAFDPRLTARDRRRWRRVLDQINARRPLTPRRADTATRMAFRKDGL